MKHTTFHCNMTNPKVTQKELKCKEMFCVAFILLINVLYINDVA